MARRIETAIAAKASFTMTLASLTAGSARQSTMVTNDTAGTSRYPAAIVMFRIESGTAPAAGNIYSIFLLRADAASGATYFTDNAGTSDAAITIENATLLGTIIVTATANKNFYGDFDTAPLGPLSTQWGCAVRNDTGQSLNATEGNHIKQYQLYLPEIQ